MDNAIAAPAHHPVNLRGDYSQADGDYLVDPNTHRHSAVDLQVWRRLFDRQVRDLATRAVPEVVTGLRELALDRDRIPDLEATSRRLQRLSDWTLVAVPGLIPEHAFFGHLAARRFPVTVWMRAPHEIDYLVEPDFFHDFFGHVPLLAHRVFGDFVQRYGQLAASAADEAWMRPLARLYWYTVEFGLQRTAEGLRAYGAGILSSHRETEYALHSPVPRRHSFDAARVLRTPYCIDALQLQYFVVDRLEALYEAVDAPEFRAAWSEAALAARACAPTVATPENAPG